MFQSHELLQYVCVVLAKRSHTTQGFKQFAWRGCPFKNPLHGIWESRDRSRKIALRVWEPIQGMWHHSGSKSAGEGPKFPAPGIACQESRGPASSCASPVAQESITEDSGICFQMRKTFSKCVLEYPPPLAALTAHGAEEKKAVFPATKGRRGHAPPGTPPACGADMEAWVLARLLLAPH